MFCSRNALIGIESYVAKLQIINIVKIVFNKWLPLVTHIL